MQTVDKLTNEDPPGFDISYEKRKRKIPTTSARLPNAAAKQIPRLTNLYTIIIVYDMDLYCMHSMISTIVWQLIN